jgi:hypothetical protein
MVSITDPIIDRNCIYILPKVAASPDVGFVGDPLQPLVNCNFLFSTFLRRF